MSAMQLALEALEQIHPGNLTPMAEEAWNKAITALRQALVDADDTSEKRVDETVKTEHDRAVELGKAYERGWNAALAQQEPVAWLSTDCIGERYLCFTKPKDNDPVQPLYTAPPKQWVGLTLNEAEEFYDKYTDRAELINAIDRFLEEKNA